MVSNQTRVLETDESDEQADARGNGMFKRFGYGIDQHLAHAGHGKDQEQYSRDKHHAQCRLPGHAEAEADLKSEEGVKAHARRERNGVTRGQGHDDGGERGGQTGGHHHRVEIHARFGKDVGVNKDDIGHGHEGGNAAHNLGAKVSTQGLELKIIAQFL